MSEESKGTDQASGKEPEEARWAFRELVNQAVTEATYVNRSAVVGGVGDLFTLVFGFSAGFPDHDGNMQPKVSVQPAVIGSRKLLQGLVNGIAAATGIVAVPKSQGEQDG